MKTSLVILLVVALTIVGYLVGHIGGTETGEVKTESPLSTGGEVTVSVPNPVLECNAGQELCQESSLWICNTSSKGTSWQLVGIVPQRCNVAQIASDGKPISNSVGECATGQEKCDGKNFITCTTNKLWLSQGTVMGKCGVECYSGEKCESKTTVSCQFNKWIQVGLVDGKCGYVAPQPDTCTNSYDCGNAQSCSVTINGNYWCRCTEGTCETPTISGDSSYQYICYKRAGFCVTWGHLGIISGEGLTSNPAPPTYAPECYGTTWICINGVAKQCKDSKYVTLGSPCNLYPAREL